MNKYELNYSNTEYGERHRGCKNRPKQQALEWHKWGELVDFFKGYFAYFGDDISGIDDTTFECMVKTIWRFGHVNGAYDGRETQRMLTPTFEEQLNNWKMAVHEHNRNAEEEGDIHLRWDDLMDGHGYNYESFLA